MNLRFVRTLATYDLTKFKTFRGLGDYLLKDHRKFYPWGFPMNGQTSRLEATRQIIFNVKIGRIIETGTYRGTTTEWFSQFGIPVQTVEIDDRYFAFSKARLRGRVNVSVVRGSSIPFLQEITSLKRTSKEEPLLFYLDSHWGEHLPLREELELIFKNYVNPVVLVDDCKVSDDAGYGYDDYGFGKAITLEYVAESAVPKLWCFYPFTPSYQETGHRRGWVVLTSSEMIANSLRKIHLLREHKSGCS